MRTIHWLVVPVLLCVACDWRPFSDLEKNTPVVLLKRPGSFKQGFGAAVATATDSEGETRAIVVGSAGQSPAATFAFGQDEELGEASVDSAGCNNDPTTPESRCGVANQLAGMAGFKLGAEENKLCFVLGIGVTATLATMPPTEGLVVRCADRTEYTLLIPKAVTDTVIRDRDLNSIPQPLFLATDRDAFPALLAGSPNQALAWFYGAGKSDPELIETPAGETTQGFGSAVAVLKLANGVSGARLFAIAASGSSHVWLYRSDDGVAASAVGCFSGATGFGQALASGDVDNDGVDDLVVSDASTAAVVSGAKLGLLPAVDAPACSALPADTILAQATCAGADCANSGFGTAVAVGDLNGDGTGELIVGAPTMKVRKRAGAVLLYRVAGGAATLADTLFISSAGGGDELGTTVAAAQLAHRSVVVAGGAGGAKAAVFFCSSLVPEDQRGVRCE